MTEVQSDPIEKISEIAITEHKKSQESIVEFTLDNNTTKCIDCWMDVLKLLWKMILTVSIFDNSQFIYVILQSKIICIAYMRSTNHFVAFNFPKNEAII